MIVMLLVLLLFVVVPANAQDASGLLLERYMDSPLTLGRPATGYAYAPSSSPLRVRLHVDAAAGWNESLTSNEGRTGVPAIWVEVNHEGQGDASGMTVICRVSGLPRGSTLANPACVLVNGQVDAQADGVLMNAGEIHMLDYGYRNVSGAGWVVDYRREGKDTEDIGQFRYGYRSQSTGPLPIDAHFSGFGRARTGLDLTGVDSAQQAGIALRDGDRIYWRATPGIPPQGASDFGATWTGAYPYADGEVGIMTVVDGNPTLQVQRDWLAVAGHVAITGELVLLPPRDLQRGECARPLELLPSGHVVAGEMRCR